MIPPLAINGMQINPEILLDGVAHRQLAAACGVGLPEFYIRVERWANGPALPWGYHVDRQAGKVTRFTR